MSNEQAPETNEQLAMRLGGAKALRAYRREQFGVLSPDEPTWRDLCNFDEDEGS